MDALNLKRCPFCGGIAMIRKNEERVKPFYVRCGNMDCKLTIITNYCATEEEAIEIWNRRFKDAD